MCGRNENDKRKNRKHLHIFSEFILTLSSIKVVHVKYYIWIILIKWRLFFYYELLLFSFCIYNNINIMFSY